MDEFKKAVWEVIAAMSQDWVDALKTADESGEGVDLSEMFGKFTKRTAELEEKFIQFRQRMKQKKRGFFS